MVHHAAQAQCNLRPWRSGKKGGIVCGLVSVVFPVIDKGLFISRCSRKALSMLAWNILMFYLIMHRPTVWLF